MILAHAFSDSQLYHVSMNEDTVNLGIRLKGVDVSIPAGDSAYLDLLYGGTFTDGSPVATGVNPPDTPGAQPPMVFASTSGDNTQFLRYYLAGGLTRIDWRGDSFRFLGSAAQLSYMVTGAGGWVNLYGDLEAYG